MKTLSNILRLILLVLLLATSGWLRAQGTAFTYQGHLLNGTNPASGTYNFQFLLYNASSGGGQVGSTVTTTGVGVTNGLFTVLIDFGAGIFTGTTNWLQIGVETNGGGSYATLSPRQEVTPTPNAIYAENAGNLSGTLALAQLPAGVVTNNEVSVTLTNLTLNGGLTLPASETIPLTVNSGSDSLLYADDNGNFFDGVDAGNGVTSGFQNTATGNSALQNVSFSDDNTADGFKALYRNSSGSYNTASGTFALEANTSGSYNTADGFGALEFNGTGGSNTAVGTLALYQNTSGYANTAAGFHSLFSNTNGYENTASGFQALLANIGGADNTANGAYALGSNTTGSYNTAMGADALVKNTTGSYNTASGDEALFINGAGSYNTADGFNALFDNVAGTYNTASGAWALYNNNYGSNNTASGGQALYYNTTGLSNVANGYQALYSNTVGIANTADGAQALYANTSGIQNTASGALALFSNTNGTGNTADGVQALYNNTSGYYNTGIGVGALYNNETGSNNTAVGVDALSEGGNYNTAIGGAALFFATGYQNIGLGYNGGKAVTTGNNNIEIFDEGLNIDNGVIRIGTQGTQTATYIAGISGATAASGVEVYVNSSGQLGTATSSARFKQDIQSMDSASDVLLSLHPVKFKYKSELDPQAIPQFGLVAEEVEKVDPDLVARDAKGQINTVRYNAVNAMLLNEFLKQHKKVEEQNAEIQGLKQSMADLKKMVESLAEKK